MKRLLSLCFVFLLVFGFSVNCFSVGVDAAVVSTKWVNGSLDSGVPVYGVPHILLSNVIKTDGKVIITVNSGYRIFAAMYNENNDYLGFVGWSEDKLEFENYGFIRVLIRRNDGSNLLPSDISYVNPVISVGGVDTYSSVNQRVLTDGLHDFHEIKYIYRFGDYGQFIYSGYDTRFFDGYSGSNQYAHITLLPGYRYYIDCMITGSEVSSFIEGEILYDSELADIEIYRNKYKHTGIVQYGIFSFCWTYSILVIPKVKHDFQFDAGHEIVLSPSAYGDYYSSEFRLNNFTVTGEHIGDEKVVVDDSIDDVSDGINDAVSGFEDSLDVAGDKETQDSLQGVLNGDIPEAVLELPELSIDVGGESLTFFEGYKYRFQEIEENFGGVLAVVRAMFIALFYLLILRLMSREISKLIGAGGE